MHKRICLAHILVDTFRVTSIGKNVIANFAYEVDELLILNVIYAYMIHALRASVIEYNVITSEYS